MDKNCLFCKIIAGEVPSKYLFSNERLIAFRDINAQAPTHVLICPTRHISALSDSQDSDRELLGEIQLTAKNLAKDLGLEAFRLVLNNGKSAGQTVDHVHYHLLGGRRMTWPPG